MPYRDIHLRILSEHKGALKKFIELGAFNKDVKYGDDFVEVDVYIDKTKEKTTKIRIASEITNILINIIKKEVLKENIQKIYKEIYDKEVENIYRHSLELFHEKETFIKESIFNRVYDYISTNNQINIDGFVKFRMKDFLNYISKLSDRGLEEYLIKKDQDEFINVLKYFVEVQEEKIDILKVHILKDGSFILCDKEDNILENKNNEDIINMVLKENLNYEDFLISTLLTLCPKKILIYDNLENNTSKEIIETVKSIFDDRVVVQQRA